MRNAFKSLLIVGAIALLGAAMSGMVPRAEQGLNQWMFQLEVVGALAPAPGSEAASLASVSIGFEGHPADVVLAPAQLQSELNRAKCRRGPCAIRLCTGYVDEEAQHQCWRRTALGPIEAAVDEARKAGRGKVVRRLLESYELVTAAIADPASDVVLIVRERPGVFDPSSRVGLR